MKLGQSQIKEIAQEVEAGMKVFINRDDFEIRSILDWDEIYEDTDFWEKELEKIETEWTDYIVIEKLDSRNSFVIMEDFAEKLDNNELRQVLQLKSPFANFKNIVESSEYRNEWFEYKRLRHEEYVKETLELEKIEYE